jgi:hypothetical protein
VVAAAFTAARAILRFAATGEGGAESEESEESDEDEAARHRTYSRRAVRARSQLISQQGAECVQQHAHNKAATKLCDPARNGGVRCDGWHMMKTMKTTKTRQVYSLMGAACGTAYLPLDQGRERPGKDQERA